MITRKDVAMKKEQKKRAARRISTYVLTLSCVALLASGFFFAAHQHFSSMDFGMKNSRLRRQIDQLEAEKRRLMLSKEIALSPTEIKKAVKKAGMLDPVPTESQPVIAEIPVRAKTIAPATTADKTLIAKTASVEQVPTRVNALLKKNDRPNKDVKKAVLAE